MEMQSRFCAMIFTDNLNLPDIEKMKEVAAADFEIYTAAKTTNTLLYSNEFPQLDLIWQSATNV